MSPIQEVLGFLAVSMLATSSSQQSLRRSQRMMFLAVRL